MAKQLQSRCTWSKSQVMLEDPALSSCSVGFCLSWGIFQRLFLSVFIGFCNDSFRERA